MIINHVHADNSGAMVGVIGVTFSAMVIIAFIGSKMQRCVSCLEHWSAASVSLGVFVPT